MRRRSFIAGGLVGSALLPMAAHGQRRDRVPRVGVLWHAANAEEEGSNYSKLVEGFRRLGYDDGRNIRLEHRYPDERPERFRSMAAELASMPVDVLIAVGNNAAPYAMAATTTIPVVFILVADPVGSGLVDSIARPSGNGTGISNFASELIPKRMQILTQVVPDLARVAQLVNPNARISALYTDIARSAASHLNLALHFFEARGPDDIATAFDAMKLAGMQALLVNADGVAFTHRVAISRLSLQHRIPLAVWSEETFRTGALMSYGADADAICLRASYYVDRLLNGSKPSQLPVEQATHFKLLFNLRTARTLGISVPATLLAIADEVIE